MRSVTTDVDAVHVRHRYAAAVVAAALSVAALLSMRPTVIGFIHDDGVYTVVAKSISQGTGHRIVSLPGSPHETLYPFAYPFVLSLLWRINPVFPDNVWLLKSVNALSAFGVMLLGYELFRRHTGRSGSWALVYVFLIGTNPVLVSFTDFTLSESLFLFFTMAALVLHDRPPFNGSGERVDRANVGTPWHLWCGAIASALAFLTRSVGASLIVAGLLYTFVRRRRLDAIVYGVIVIAPVLPWLIWRASAPLVTNPLLTYYTGYNTPALGLLWSDPGQGWAIISANARYLVKAFDDSFLLRAVPGVRWLFYPIVLLGGFSVVRQAPIFLLVFVSTYLVAILGHPFPPGRFVVPLVPVLLMCLFAGLCAIEARFATSTRGRGHRRLVGDLVRIPVGLLMVMNLAWFAVYFQRSTDNPIRGIVGAQLSYGWDGFLETFDWIRNHTDDSAVLAVPLDPMYYLYTGRRGVRPWFFRPETYYYPYGRQVPDFGDPEKIRDALDLLGVRYVVADPIEGVAPSAPRIFEDLLGVYGSRARLVFVSGDARHKIYELKPRLEAVPPAAR